MLRYYGRLAQEEMSMLQVTGYVYYGWQYIDYFGISSNKWFGGVKLRLERFSEKP